MRRINVFLFLSVIVFSVLLYGCGSDSGGGGGGGVSSVTVTIGASFPTDIDYVTVHNDRPANVNAAISSIVADTVFAYTTSENFSTDITNDGPLWGGGNVYMCLYTLGGESFTDIYCSVLRIQLSSGNNIIDYSASAFVAANAGLQFNYP